MRTRLTTRFSRTVAVGVTTLALAAGVGVTTTAVAATSLTKAKADAVKVINAKVAQYDSVASIMASRDLGAEYGKQFFLPNPAPLGTNDDPIIARAAKERALVNALRTSVGKAKTTTQVASYKATASKYNPNNYITAQSLLLTAGDDVRAVKAEIAVKKAEIAVVTPRVTGPGSPAQDWVSVLDNKVDDLTYVLGYTESPLRKAQAVSGLTSASTLKALKYEVVWENHPSVAENVYVAQEYTADLRVNGYLPLLK